MRVIVTCVLLVSLILEINGADLISPCPHILRYEELKANDRWQGLLELGVQQAIEGIWMNIVLDSKADVLINSFGESTTLNNQNFAISRPNYTLLPGAILKIRFTIKYSPDKPVPNVVSIRLNGVEICEKLALNIPTVNPPTTVVSSPSTEDPLIDVRRPSDVECGIKTQARPLVYNGQLAEGHWPWHVAIMILKTSKFDYHCGGSLISGDYILTAAHCVTKLTTRKLIDNEMFVLYLGMTDLSDPGPSFKLRLVANIEIHNQYNPTRYHNDLAVIKLSEPVEFNDFIRPVCLWDGDMQIRDLVGQFGTVVGWGLDNSNKTANNLIVAKLPVVGLETCLYHDRNFFSQYTSLSTYCAGGGGNDGSAVCSGDSGGGMVFPKPGTKGKDQIWRIRGLVSVSPRDSDSVCNTRSYAVFTDIVPHLTWIKEAAKLK